MNLSELQADLRHFAAERDWQPFHTPKNLSTALTVESAELAQIFQWMTPEQSTLAHQDALVKQSISDEVADVLLYLLQMADHCEINVERAVRDKLARLKYPAKRQIARVSPARAKAVAKKVPPAPAAKKTSAAKVAPAKEAAPVKKPVTKATAPAPAKMAASLPSGVATGPVPARAPSPPARPSTVSADEINRIMENLRKLGVNRPTKPASLRRLLKSLLAAETRDPSIEMALGNLVAAGAVALGAGSEVKYPAF